MMLCCCSEIAKSHVSWLRADRIEILGNAVFKHFSFWWKNSRQIPQLFDWRPHFDCLTAFCSSGWCEFFPFCSDLNRANPSTQSVLSDRKPERATWLMLALKENLEFKFTWLIFHWRFICIIFWFFSPVFFCALVGKLKSGDHAFL
jgi:hypothetical protein